VRFVPESVTLPGGARAEVLPAETVDGELRVPEHVQHVGWWDGSSYAGDPFGSTVIAGHVDSATEGIGFFARLLRVRVGDRVTLGGEGHRARYRVVSVQLVAKKALSSDSHAFDQTGDHRLVLITCGGAYHRDRGGYDSNLVLAGVPKGPVR
jgi:LPXTG-site transpeptidase (sortase) family protein